MKQSLSFLLVLIFAVTLGSQPSGRETVGRQADGTVLLPNGWKIAPVGRAGAARHSADVVGDFAERGRFVLVLERRLQTADEISVIDAASKKRIVAGEGTADGWLGLTFSADGKFVYVGGGSRYRVFEFFLLEPTGS